MVRSPLESAWHKYRWAQHHAQSVNRQLQRIFDADRDVLTIDVQVEQTGNEATATARIDRLPIIHERCGLAFGDAIQNFRAALDHIAWNLVKIGKTPKPKKPKAVQFPMCSSFAEFKGEKPRRLPGISKDQVAVIREYQPYRRGIHGTAIRRLGRFSNLDKHRVLIPRVVTPAGHNIEIRSNWQFAGRPDFFINNRRALKVNTKVMETKLVRSGAGDCQVSVSGNLQVYPSLGRGLHIDQALVEIDVTVFSLLESLEETL